MAPGIRAVLAVVLCVLAAPMVGQGADAQGPAGDAQGPTVVPLVYHPYPDPVDPLGFPHGGTSVFQARYGHLWQGNYPAILVDGVDLVEGLPGDGSVAAVTEAYDETVSGRFAKASPAEIGIMGLHENGTLRAMIQVRPVAPVEGDDLRLHVALMEDPVHFRHAQDIHFNGVEEHPFTVRAYADLGPVTLGDEPLGTSHAFDVADFDLSRLWIAVWLQQGSSHGVHYAPLEVAQAAMHKADAATATFRSEKGVLLESISATWCDTCFQGDLALESVADTYGFPLQRGAATAGYLVVPSDWPVAALAALAAVVVFWRRT